MTISGIVNIQETASDDISVKKVEIKIGNGNWTVVNETTTWNYTWDTTGFDNGDYIVQARAYDGHEYSNIDVITVKVNNKKGGIPGFEFIALIAAMAAVLLWKKKE
ncbi:MAG: Ig-like domain-containing protein [Candidatus Thermoplasmatota archaeon]|nr:Ig-like domain-containing protein [Candidatus Thermoplasmatota archaeon]